MSTQDRSSLPAPRPAQSEPRTQATRHPVAHKSQPTPGQLVHCRGPEREPSIEPTPSHLTHGMHHTRGGRSAWARVGRRTTVRQARAHRGSECWVSFKNPRRTGLARRAILLICLEYHESTTPQIILSLLSLATLRAVVASVFWKCWSHRCVSRRVPGVCSSTCLGMISLNTPCAPLRVDVRVGWVTDGLLARPRIERMTLTLQHVYYGRW